MNQRQRHVLGVLFVYGPMPLRKIASAPSDGPALSASQCYHCVRSCILLGWVAHERREFYRLTERGDEVLKGRQQGLFTAAAAKPPKRIPVKSLAKRQVVKSHDALRAAVDAGQKLAWTRLMIYGLDCFCGLRASEIAGANVGDVDIDPTGNVTPAIRVRRETTKSDAGARAVPLNWNLKFLQDLKDYFAWRFGADWWQRRQELRDLPLVVSFRSRVVVPFCPRQGLFDFANHAPGAQAIECRGRRLHRNTIRKYFISGAKRGGVDVETYRITTHVGRGTCASLAHSVGKRSVAQLRDLLGHSEIKVTNDYIASLGDPSDVNCMGDMYAIAPQ